MGHKLVEECFQNLFCTYKFLCTSFKTISYYRSLFIRLHLTNPFMNFSVGASCYSAYKNIKACILERSTLIIFQSYQGTYWRTIGMLSNWVLSLFKLLNFMYDLKWNKYWIHTWYESSFLRYHNNSRSNGIGLKYRAIFNVKVERFKMHSNANRV